MAARRAFKSDVSFLEKISMGAVGTRQVLADTTRQGHTPIVLERGSTSFKIWKQIKIKRIRVPDILCVACARRIESRAKTNLEITMSHSFSDPERGWDHGLADGDLTALVKCRKVGEAPTAWQANPVVQYASVKDLRAAQAAGQVHTVRPKGPEEGFEARITWPAAVARSSGTVTGISDDRLQYRRQPDNRVISLALVRNGVKMRALVGVGDAVQEDQFVAAVVPVSASFPCPKSANVEHYVQQLSSASLSERYGAAKALASFAPAETRRALVGRVQDEAEHVFVRLEAAAALARQGIDAGWGFIEGCLADPYLQQRLEAVIALAEIRSPRSAGLLCGVLRDEEQHPEIRAGAAWGLGELGDGSALDALVETFRGVEEDVRVEAARALAKLGSRFTPELLERFKAVTPVERPGVAWALSRDARLRADDLLASLVDEDARQWAAYVLGMQDPQRFVADLEALRERDPEVFFAVTVLWKVVSSWVYDLEEQG